ncbi:uncharacterized protein LOC18424440 [Amborella trichopoda]|uniref:Ornithine cyclodeaminase n=1 Tax=Amborella trichopoda TaxID=13333 RepID=W1NLV7_AMBTC|nr:uncharacterized protein LOC18424440 [Amborella trichopoda]ERM96506.1 hypothetical protein AMTR_s00001p00262160 [Amborella trichopoda]|eukprot:XP_006829090.1 uncharacterized protein LOC18424440 [Amborella trichopoda]
MASSTNNGEGVKHQNPAPAPPRQISSIAVIDGSAVDSILSFPSLIHHLRSTLPSLSPSIHTPHRHIHPIIHNTIPNSDSALLLMPSFSSSPLLPYLGIKLLTSFPHSSPSIKASYLLLHSLTGQTLALIDGTALTLWRTAALSALASSFLSDPDPQTLTMLGAGSLAPFLIRAHLSARPSINKVIIWNRTPQKAQTLVHDLEPAVGSVKLELARGLEEAVRAGDLVSCATGSEVPMVRGEMLLRIGGPGVHLDLVGSFRPTMRECDEEVIERGRVFVDCEAAFEEAGEIVGMREKGIKVGLLVDLLKGLERGRMKREELTVFKSVGSGLVDLLSAQMVYETYIQGNV